MGGVNRPSHRHIRIRIQGRRVRLRGLPAVAAVVVVAALGAALVALSAVIGLLLLAGGLAVSALGALGWATRRALQPTPERPSRPDAEPDPRETIRDVGTRQADPPADRRPGGTRVEVIEIDDPEVLGPEDGR